MPFALFALVLCVVRSGAKALGIKLDPENAIDQYDGMIEAFPVCAEEVAFACRMLLFVALLYGTLATAGAAEAAPKRVKKSK